MKKLKKIIVLFTAALFCLLPIFSNPLTAQAAEPVTYYIKYVEANSDWRFQIGEWKEDGYHRELYYMMQDIKDGDLLVVSGPGELSLDVGVSLSNLTFASGTTSVAIHTKGVTDFYAINDSIGAVNGNVQNAYVYDNCVINFNNNVSYLEIASQGENLGASVAVIGTVDHVKALDKNQVHFNLYAFKENTFRMEKGTVTTETGNFSLTPVATPAPTTPTTPAAPSTGSSASDYDDVPKTADVSVSPLWFVGIAVLCLLGSYELKRR